MVVLRRFVLRLLVFPYLFPPPPSSSIIVDRLFDELFFLCDKGLTDDFDKGLDELFFVNIKFFS